MLELLTIVIVLAACAVFILLLNKIDTIIDSKRKKKYPKFFELLNRVEQKGHESSSYYVNEIVSRKNQIDIIIKEWNYYTDEVRAQKTEELVKLRQELQERKAKDDILSNELRELRKEIHDYVSSHNIKWAKKMGW